MNLTEGAIRFGEVSQRFPQITEKFLTAQLRGLEKDGIVVRTVYPEVPVRVEYALSAFGKSLIPILKETNTWGSGFREMTDIL